MGSEDCERHVETKIYRADAWRICSDLNFEFCFNWSPRNGQELMRAWILILMRTIKT